MAATTIIAQTTVPAGDMSATSWFLVSSPTDCRHGEDLDAALKSPRPQGLTTRSASQDNSLIARIDNSSQTSSEDLTETLSKVSLKSSSIKGQKTSEHAHPKDIVLRLEQLCRLSL